MQKFNLLIAPAILVFNYHHLYCKLSHPLNICEQKLLTDWLIQHRVTCYRLNVFPIAREFVEHIFLELSSSLDTDTEVFDYHYLYHKISYIVTVEQPYSIFTLCSPFVSVNASKLNDDLLLTCVVIAFDFSYNVYKCPCCVSSVLVQAEVFVASYSNLYIFTSDHDW